MLSARHHIGLATPAWLPDVPFVRYMPLLSRTIVLPDAVPHWTILGSQSHLLPVYRNLSQLFHTHTPVTVVGVGASGVYHGLAPTFRLTHRISRPSVY